MGDYYVRSQAYGLANGQQVIAEQLLSRCPTGGFIVAVYVYVQVEIDQLADEVLPCRPLRVLGIPLFRYWGSQYARVESSGWRCAQLQEHATAKTAQHVLQRSWSAVREDITTWQRELEIASAELQQIAESVGMQLLEGPETYGAYRDEARMARGGVGGSGVPGKLAKEVRALCARGDKVGRWRYSYGLLSVEILRKGVEAEWVELEAEDEDDQE